MRIVVFGAGGIIGQTMRLCIPQGIEPVWVRTRAWRRDGGADWWFYGLNLATGAGAIAPEGMAPADPRDLFLRAFAPAAIINLAGENRPDVVERNPRAYQPINVEAPAWLSWWCEQHGVHYVHVSSQAVFGADPPKEMQHHPSASPPYGADSVRLPVNAYGYQKLQAEIQVAAAGKHWSIVRPTFTLGIRPFPLIGRENPAEYWLSQTAPVVESESTGAKLREVSDRFFSPAFAWDVAERLWEIAKGEPLRGFVNVGAPVSTTRYELAQRLRTDIEVEPVAHDDAFPHLAPRPKDTTYAVAGAPDIDVKAGLDRCEREYCERQFMTAAQRARELCIFLGKPYEECLSRLRGGFGQLHADVAADWRKANPQTDDEILEWYRATEAYLWELSAYHCDPGFNYTGMCQGIVDRLRAEGVNEALCLGDGIGDLTIALGRAGIHGIYHDLKDSRTAEFAEFRQQMYLGTCDMGCTAGWEPLIPVEPGTMPAILSLDFLEHCTDVEAWVRAIFDRLKPGGLFCAQNAFALGSGPDGSMPMHLARNDRFEKDWDPLLTAVGFEQLGPQWYRKPETR